MWKWYAIMSAVFAALTAIFAKIGIKDIHSDLATAIRTVVIIIITWGIVIGKGYIPEIKNIQFHTWAFLVLSGVATGLSWLCYFKAIQLGDVSKVAPIDKLSVVFTMVLAFVFLKEQITLRTILGGVLIAAGSLVLIMK